MVWGRISQRLVLFQNRAGSCAGHNISDIGVVSNPASCGARQDISDIGGVSGAGLDQSCKTRFIMALLDDLVLNVSSSRRQCCVRMQQPARTPHDPGAPPGGGTAAYGMH